MKYELTEYNKIVFQPAIKRAEDKIRKEMQALVRQAYKDGYNTAIDKTTRKYICKNCKISALQGEKK